MKPRETSIEKFTPLLSAWASAWSYRGDADFTGILTEDCVYEDVATERVFIGIADITDFAREVRTAFPDFAVRLTSEMFTGSHASAEWEMTGTNGGELLGLPATNRAISVRGASMFEIEAGRFKRCSDYCNLASLLRQLGLN
jgi:steroid delta-isomerase-like uncharacterized protein